jgi:hypothetical protein
MNNSQQPSLLYVLQKSVSLKNMQNYHVVLNIRSQSTLRPKTTILKLTIFYIVTILASAISGNVVRGGVK